MEKQYGVLLVGCGYIGETHLADIHYRNDINVVAVVDTDICRAEHLAKKYGISQYGVDYRQYIDREEVEIVIIATYVDSHLSIMEDCIASKCHVLCEKPVAATREDGERFFRIAGAASTRVLIGHELRCNRSYRKIKSLIQAEAIGTLKLIRIIQNHHAVNWDRYQRLMQDCPPVLDCGVHYMDVMQWMFDEKMLSVTGAGCYLDSDAPCPNYGAVHVLFPNGGMGIYESGWSRHLKACNQKEFIGDRGSIRLTLREDRVADKEEGDLIEVYHSDTGVYEIINYPSKYKNMYGQMQALIRRIEGIPDDGITLEEAREAFMAAYEAKERIEENLRR